MNLETGFLVTYTTNIDREKGSIAEFIRRTANASLEVKILTGVRTGRKRMIHPTRVSPYWLQPGEVYDVVFSGVSMRVRIKGVITLSRDTRVICDQVGKKSTIYIPLEDAIEKMVYYGGV